MLRRVASGDPPSWSRRKMVALLAGAATATVLLVAGLALAVLYGLHPTGRAAGNHTPGGGTGSASASTGANAAPDPAAAAQRAQDALANAPMPLLAAAAAQPGPVSPRAPQPALVLPAPTTIGPESVAAGFPHTALGAMAQLAALDQTALQSRSLAGARAVITAWALPGGPTASSWSGVAALAGFLNAAGLSGGGSPQLALVLTPVMGLIKGTVGADFVIPCLDFEADATLAQTARVAVADCQRMVWTGQRWMIGPGSEPADAPSVWPDTDQAIEVGYRDVRHG